MTPEEGYQEALRRIRAVKESRASKLNLSDLNLTVLPDVLGELTFLESLGLIGNPVADISVLSMLTDLKELKLGYGWHQQLGKYFPGQSALSDLSPLSGLLQLESLDFSGTEVSDLSPLSGLLQLDSLDFGGTEVSDLSPLSVLLRLKRLYCGHTKVVDLSPLSGLLQLDSLGFGGTEVSDLSPLSGLLRLEYLNCNDTQVSDLGPLRGLLQLSWLDCDDTQVSDLSPLSGLLQLQHLHFMNTKVNDLAPLKVVNSIKTLLCYGSPVVGIPIEMVRKFNSAEMLRGYWSACGQDAQPNNRIKLILVGNGRAGKSTLAHNLVHGRPPEQAVEERTHGIALNHFTLKDDSLKHPIEVQVWDFGGQEIYHATHRLFLASRGIYVLLWHDNDMVEQEDGDHPIRYWYDLIRQQNKEAPILLVKNKIDLPEKELPADYLEVSKHCSQSIRISAQLGKGITALRGALAEAVNDYRRAWDYPIPISWARIRERLEQRCQSGDRYIPLSKYEEVCEREEVAAPEVLLAYLNSSGSLIYREGLFNNQIILDQNWVIELVYKLFDPRLLWKERVTDAKGRFKGYETALFWAEYRDREAERKLFIDYLINAQLAYCADRWPIPFDQRTYVVPTLLPEQMPAARLHWQSCTADEVIFNITYAILHRALFEKLLVRLVKTSLHHDICRNGIWLEDQNSGCELLLEYQNTSRNQYGLQIRIRGKDVPQLWSKVEKQIKEVIGNIDCQISVKTADAESTDIAVWKNAHPVARENLDHAGQQTEPSTVRVFVSYNHKDAELCKKFVQQLEIIKWLCNDRITYYVDHKTVAGENIDDTINQQLQECNVFCALVSNDFLTSRYCRDVELKYAKEQAGRITTVPIILRKTPSWPQFFSGELAAPTDGRPLQDPHWHSPDDYWADVHEKLIRVFEKHGVKAKPAH